LNEVTNLRETPQSISGDVFDHVNLSAVTLKVPAGAVDAYKKAGVWKDFKNIEAIE
jgi:hypothetical protein